MKKKISTQVVSIDSSDWGGHAFYNSAFFREMLVIERKRTERSHKPFLLMLIDVSKIQGLLSPKKIHKLMCKVSQENTRDIDIKGWYEDNRIVGIIFTEVTAEGKGPVCEKIQKAIDRSISPDLGLIINITCIAYPTDVSKVDEAEHVTHYFYPDRHHTSMDETINMALKRTLDITGSFIGIIALSPLLLFIGLWIKVASPGPVFFRQRRVGKGGRCFTILKFRSMRVNNDNSAHKEFVAKFIKGGINQPGSNAPIYKIKDDPRITPVGKFIRKTSFDELPQLINVLLGDMSLVGPRPALPYEVDQYDNWHRYRSFEVKPGITGLWQLEGRSITNFENMTRMDIRYIRQWSILLDIKLLIKTPWVMISTKGAY